MTIIIRLWKDWKMRLLKKWMHDSFLLFLVFEGPTKLFSKRPFLHSSDCNRIVAANSLRNILQLFVRFQMQHFLWHEACKRALPLKWAWSKCRGLATSFERRTIATSFKISHQAPTFWLCAISAEELLFWCSYENENYFNNNYYCL